MRRAFIIFIILIAATFGVFFGFILNRNSMPIPVESRVCISCLGPDFGGAIMLSTPDNVLTIIDPGPEETANMVVKYVRAVHAKSIDVVVTNPTPARCGALPAILDAFSIRRIIHGEKPISSFSLRHVMSQKTECDFRDVVVGSGDEIDASSNVKIQILGPPKGLMPYEKPSSDNNALVLRIVYKERSFLIASDIGPEGEACLVKQGCDIESDGFILARYAQYGSNSLELLSTVRPAYLIVPCNSWQIRPNPGILKKIDKKNSGAVVYRTDKDGTIHVFTDGHRILVQAH